jgi:DNA-binding CsgD family transcriptional regulator
MAKPPQTTGSEVKHSVSNSTHSLDPALLLLHEAMDLDHLWKAIVKLCGNSMPMDHMVAALPFEGLAPMALRTTVPHHDTEAFWLRLYAAEPPLFKLVQQHPGLKLSDLDVQLGEEELKRSRFYKEVMVPDGWRHSVALMFWEGGRFIAHIGLCRAEVQGRFTDEEKNFLLEFHPYLDAAIRRVALIARQQQISSLLKEALEHPADGVTLMDSKGNVVFQNHAASVICAMWRWGKGAAAESIRPGEEVELPEDVSGAAKDLMEKFLADFHTKSLKRANFEKEILHPEGLSVSARARVIAPKLRPVQPHVRIEFSRAPSAGGHDAGLPVYRLSQGEHRVALLVARGLRNQEVAAELGLSVNTVRAHLREIFSKLGVVHRGQLSTVLAPLEPAEPDYSV